MLTPLRDWLLSQGLDIQMAELLTTVAQVALVLVLAAIADVVAKRVVVRGLETFFGRTATGWDDIIVERRLLHRLSHLAPALVIYLFAVPVLEGYDVWIVLVRRVALIYMIVVTVLAVDAVLNALVDILRPSAVARDLPVKSVVQVLKLLLYGVAVIAVVSLIIGQSPSLLLGRSRRHDGRLDVGLQKTHSSGWLQVSSSPPTGWSRGVTGSRCRSTVLTATCSRSR